MAGLADEGYFPLSAGLPMGGYVATTSRVGSFSGMFRARRGFMIVSSHGSGWWGESGNPRIARAGGIEREGGEAGLCRQASTSRAWVCIGPPDPRSPERKRSTHTRATKEG